MRRLAVVIWAVFMVPSCAPQKRARHRPPAHAHMGQPPPNYRPPAPRIPRNASRLNNVRFGFLPVGACLPGFVRGSNGLCSLPPTAFPNLGSVALPWLQPATATLPTAPQAPAYVHISVDSMLINAGKTGGRCWDWGCNEKQTERLSRAAAAAAVKAGLIAGPYGAAVAILTPIIAAHYSHPDTSGWAYIYSNGDFSDPAELRVRKDTLTPQWGLMFQNVPLNQGSYLRLELVDADLQYHDDMGIITIGPEEIANALRARETHQVEVSRQTNEQVLFVGITVLPAEA